MNARLSVDQHPPKKEGNAMQRESDAAACEALAKKLGEHFGNVIATRAISEGWRVDQIHEQVEAVLADIRADLLAGGASDHDVEIVITHIHSAIGTSGKHRVMLLLDDGGNA
ncbi:gas vesicle protein [Mesorhizobium australicum]|uniref:Gas vesicle protein n=1 Tax=Mesorhizobium australicum TaxID=536018 RepID=A0ACC6T089_9HYPH